MEQKIWTRSCDGGAQGQAGGSAELCSRQHQIPAHISDKSLSGQHLQTPRDGYFIGSTNSPLITCYKMESKRNEDSSSSQFKHRFGKTKEKEQSQFTYFGRKAWVTRRKERRVVKGTECVVRKGNGHSSSCTDQLKYEISKPAEMEDSSSSQQWM